MDNTTDKKPKIVALYLPQYHPTPTNNKYWGTGFTEWTNVGKAKPLFKGHYQPKVPADLGYYDLRNPETREDQAKLAKEAGIDAFCYYHYWFEPGNEELDLPFKEVLQSGKPNFPFCLCWANESWHKKFWTNIDSFESHLIAEQKYLGIIDYTQHFYSLLTAFKDSRYFKIDGKNVFMIYQPFEHPEMKLFIELWRDLAKKNNVPDFYFIAQIKFDHILETVKKLTDMGFNAVNTNGLFYAKAMFFEKMNFFKKIVNRSRRFFTHKILGHPESIDYKDIIPLLSMDIDENEYVIPTLYPNWDHTPRSGKNGFVINNCDPNLFKQHCLTVFNLLSTKNNKLCFVKSWNEWGEGNYMEPDLKFGKGYLQAMRDAKDIDGDYSKKRSE